MAGENHSIREQQQIFDGRHGNWRPVVRVLELRTWENYNETTCDHKHTHADTRHKQKLHKPQEPNIAVTHFLTGLFLNF